jgi:oxygen-independent coproporphyrinogen-3 oxidase
MARRQGMIPTDTLPTPEERLQLFENAKKLFLWDGYKEIGIDHFAREDDGLAKAAHSGHLRRNFQGYTDDTCDVLIGIGASSISKFPQGFSQNVSATAGYQKAVRAGELATARGHVFTEDDKMRGRIIEALMCDFEVETAEIMNSFNVSEIALKRLYQDAKNQFDAMVEITPTHFRIRPEAQPLVRMIARVFDAYDVRQGSHSAAF